MEQSSTRMAPVSTWCFIFSLILLLHGIQEASGAEEGKGGEEDYLEKCCGLGSSWASEKLRCERFSGPVAGVPASEQSACLETIDICCRKKFQDDDCKLGKADAKAGLACTRSETGPRRTPVGLGDFRRDCCEGCKLGIAAGTSGKTCGLKKINLRIPWDPAFTECCNEAATSTTRKQETSPTTAMSSTVVSTSQAADSDELESIDELNDPNLNFNLTVDLCELMGSLLCSETCVPTPGSYYCNCSAGSTLQADGRTCLPDVTSTATPRSTAAATPPSTTTTTTTTTTKVTSSTTPAKKSPATTKAKTNKPAKATARSTVKVSSSVTRPRTTRSLSTEPNEHNSLCPSGYRFTSSEICDDIDECSEGPINPCPPSSMCFNTKGSFRCFSISLGNNSADRCELGYRWDDALEQCLDIDECAENIHKCLIDGEICKNLDGSYECEIVCEKGYVFDSTYGACLDIDECVELINVCLRPDTVCVNSLGSYECVKVRDYNQLNEPNLFASNGTDYGRSGFDYEDLLEEEDIDECQIHEQPCAPEEVCRNTVAGYDCIPIGCPKGFAMAEDQTCRDVDECQENSHSCAEHERCQNTNGSFTCETPRSTPAPTTAEPPKIYCRKGFKANPARQRNHSEAVSSSELCIDVDECLEGPGCREHEKCSNLLGSYECSPLCGPGWFFQPQSKSCQDVDECLLGHHNCRRSQYCVNSPGGFRCEPLGSCAAGYRRLQNGSCVDIDECLEGLHTCSRDSHRYCVNRDGGYECITRLPSCPRGYEYSLLSRQCQDVDECRQARASCDTRAERCLNLPGGYRCERLPNDPNRPGHRKRPACPNGLVYEPELRKCAGRPTVTPPPSTTDEGTAATSSSGSGVSIAR